MTGTESDRQHAKVPSRRLLSPSPAPQGAERRPRAFRLLLPLAVVLQAAGLPVIAGQASAEPEVLLVPERPPAVQAEMADTVVDGVGINVHLL